MVSNYLQDFSQRFWTPEVWLPPNVTWDDIKPNDRISYPNYNDIWYPILFSFGLTFIRLLFERCLMLILFVLFLHISIMYLNSTDTFSSLLEFEMD